jgi:hypothetical protein
MEPKEFEQTPEFSHFQREMQKLIRVPKSELDKLERRANEESPRNANPHATGRKIAKRKRRKRT